MGDCWISTRFGRGSVALLGALALVAPGAGPAYAAGVSDNAVAEADDAFGGSVGTETTGIYTDTNVRGFNPQQAGNARLDNAYFDQIATVPGRIRRATAIRVGFSSQDYLFPAPTGIVAYKLRDPKDDASIVGEVQSVNYGGWVVESDGYAPVMRDRLAVGGGFSWGVLRTPDDANNRYLALGLLGRLRLGGAELKGVFGKVRGDGADTRPIITTTGPFLPPMTADGEYLGQTWARNDINYLTYGATLRAPLTRRLDLRASLFRSQLQRKANFTEIFSVRGPDGMAGHRLLADPAQDLYSDSWEALLQYRLAQGRIRHLLVLGARGRSRHVETGGSHLVDMGAVRLGDLDREPAPQFRFGAVNLGTLDQTSVSVGYLGRLGTAAQVNLGLTKTRYEARFRSAALRSRSSAEPWLGNAALTVRPRPWLAFYGGYIRGLEDSGTAPETAANRNQQLPASQTSQIDGGVKVDVGQMHLVASAFQITKPYFSFDALNRYEVLGQVRHRGVEFSAAGNLTDRFRLIGGVVMMDPVVTAAAGTLTPVGERPVGVANLHARVDGTYRVDSAGRLSLTLAFIYDSERAASTAPYAALGGKQLFLPALGTVDIGAKYTFRVQQHPASVRMLLSNVADAGSYRVIAASSFQREDYRRFQLFLTMEY